MEVELATSRPLGRSTFSVIVDVPSASPTGTLLCNPTADLAALLGQACRLLGQRATRVRGPLAVVPRRVKLDELDDLLRDAAARLRRRGLPPALLAITWDPQAEGFSRAIETTLARGLRAVARVSSAELTEVPMMSRVTWMVSGVVRLGELDRIRASGVTWASGTFFGGATMQPRPLGYPQRVLASHGFRAGPKDTLDAMVVAGLDQLATLGAELVAGRDDDLAALARQSRLRLQREGELLRSALSALHHCRALRRDSEARLAALLTQIAEGNAANAERLLGLERAIEESKSLEDVAHQSVETARTRASSVCASERLRCQAARYGLRARERGLAHPQPREHAPAPDASLMVCA